jgi:hypothetical protein
METMNTQPQLAPIPPRLRLLQVVIALTVFSVVPLLPAAAHAPTQTGRDAHLFFARAGF